MNDQLGSFLSRQSTFKTTQELCYQLGYSDGADEATVRGSATKLLGYLREFATNRSWINDPSLMATMFLDLEDNDTKLWGHTNLPDQLSWSVDSTRITELATNLLARIMDESSPGKVAHLARGDGVLVKSDGSQIESEPNSTQLGQAHLERGQVDVHSDGQSVSLETPLLCLDAVGKRHRMSRYLTPPSTPGPKSRTARSQNIYRRRNIDGAQAPNQRLRLSSPKPKDMTFQTSSPPSLRRSSRINKTMLLSPPKTPSRIKPQRKETADIAQLSLPKVPSKIKPKPKETTDIAQPVTKTQSPSRVERSDTVKVVFHFFLMNENLGAMPIALETCNTCTEFFEQAKAAWEFQGWDGGKSRLVAVRVDYGGSEYPLIIFWKNIQAFESMIEWTERAKAHKSGVLVIRVKVLKG